MASAQDSFVEDYGTWVLRVAFQLTGDRDEAEDLAQDVAEDVLKNWRRLEAAESPRAYLRRMVVNRYLNRQRRRLTVRPLDEAAQAVSSPEEHVALRVSLWESMNRLPARQRAALVLRYYEDLTETDSARVLGCRPATVRSLNARALQRLRENWVVASSTNEGKLP